MPLGVAGCTTFSMDSNYHTALNHRIRDEAPYDVHAQKKVKCHYCGCWVRKCQVCYLCRTPQKLIPTPRNNNQRVCSPSVSHSENYRRSATPGSRSQSASGTIQRPQTAGRRSGGYASHSYLISTGASHLYPAGDTYEAAPLQRSTTQQSYDFVNTSKPLKTVATNTSRSVQAQATKIKCSYCGVWVVKGTCCKLCRKPCKLF